MHTTIIETAFIKVWPSTQSVANSKYNVAYLSEAIDSSPSSKDALANLLYTGKRLSKGLSPTGVTATAGVLPSLEFLNFSTFLVFPERTQVTVIVFLDVLTFLTWRKAIRINNSTVKIFTVASWKQYGVPSRERMQAGRLPQGMSWSIIGCNAWAGWTSGFLGTHVAINHIIDIRYPYWLIQKWVFPWDVRHVCHS